MNVSPSGWGQRVIGALFLIVAIAYGAKLIVTWLAPVVPIAFALIGLYVVGSLLLRKQR